MSRPAQVEQQIARAQELQAEMLAGEKPADPNVTDKPVTPAPQEPTEPVTQPVINSPASVPKEEYDRLDQRYRTLQGMHQADNARSRTEMSALQQTVQDLEDRLVAAEKATQAVPSLTKYVTEADEAEYGDTLDMMRRAAREEAETIASAREQKLLERIAQLEQKTGHFQNTVVPTVENITRSQQEQVKAEFWAAINTQVPDWRTVNDNADFKAWLLAEDSLTGSNRQQFLSQARNEYNAPRVIKFFEEWKRTQAGGQTPALKNTAQSDLEKLVAPGASKGGAQVAPEKKQWTRADISQFYRDVNDGKYAGKLDERKKVEKDIYDAQAEGRISS